jgi:PRTRC genetic system protein A
MLPIRAAEALSQTADELLLATLPVVAVPPSGIGFAQTPGVRLLIARNGVFIEGDNGAMCIRLKVAHWLDGHIRTPFGEIDESAQHLWKVPQPDLRMWRTAFVEQARRAWPLETAACVYFNHVTGHWRYDGKIALDASRTHVRYRPEPGTDEVVVFDFHSHGPMQAFFSDVDNADDRADSGAVKIACVFGRVQRHEVEMLGRFVVGGALSKSWAERPYIGPAAPPPPVEGIELVDGDNVIDHEDPARGSVATTEELPWAGQH